MRLEDLAGWGCALELTLHIGVELTDPRNVTVARMNRVLRALGQATATRRDLEPLLAA